MKMEKYKKCEILPSKIKIFFLHVCPKDLSVITELFIIIQNWKQQNCPSASECINKTVIQTIEYYLT